MEVDTNVRSPRRIGPDAFICEVLHPVFGWIPFTASASDVEAHGRAIYTHLAGQESANETRP